tara:strand:- start:168 stop:440 length:273 start_codon:yes stop_codon:yes gene_type:complete
MKNLNLTQLETTTLTELINNIDIDITEDSIFSCVDVNDLSKFTGIEIKKMRGVVGSLIKKDIVYIEDVDGDGTELVYLENDYFYLSNESK